MDIQREIMINRLMANMDRKVSELSDEERQFLTDFTTWFQRRDTNEDGQHIWQVWAEYLELNTSSACRLDSEFTEPTVRWFARKGDGYTVCFEDEAMVEICNGSEPDDKLLPWLAGVSLKLAVEIRTKEVKYMQSRPDGRWAFVPPSEGEYYLDTKDYRTLHWYRRGEDLGDALSGCRWCVPMFSPYTLPRSLKG